MEKFPPNAASSRVLNLPQAVVGKIVRLCSEAVLLPVQEKGILIRPPGYGSQFKPSPFFLMQNGHSGQSKQGLPKVVKPFLCLHTELTHALPCLDFHWIIKF